MLSINHQTQNLLLHTFPSASKCPSFLQNISGFGFPSMEQRNNKDSPSSDINVGGGAEVMAGRAVTATKANK